MHEFWYNYVKAKYGKKTKLCYMDTYSFILYLKEDDIYKNIPEDFRTILDKSNCELDGQLPKGKNKKIINVKTDELGGKIMTELVGLNGKKTYYYLADDNDEKIAESTKKCVINRKLKFEGYKICLQATQLENEINRPEKK